MSPRLNHRNKTRNPLKYFPVILNASYWDWKRFYFIVDSDTDITGLQKRSTPSEVGMHGAKWGILANKDRLVANGSITGFENAPFEELLLRII